MKLNIICEVNRIEPVNKILAYTTPQRQHKILKRKFIPNPHSCKLCRYHSSTNNSCAKENEVIQLHNEEDLKQWLKFNTETNECSIFVDKLDVKA